MDQSYHEIQQRIRHYWFKDGIGEVAVGWLFIALALYFAGHRVVSHAPNVPLYLNLGLFLVLAVGLVLTRKLISVLKMHITYPRTGYVEYYLEASVSLPAKIAIWTLGILFVVLLVAVGRWVGTFQWIPAFLGLIFGVVLFVLQRTASGLMRFNYHAVVSVLLGGGVSLVDGFTAQYSLSWYYGIFGGWLVVWGIGVLARYLRENPLPEGGSDE
ncbi:MAG TPA: hypothetical protein PK152_06125 [Anaerolineales bacterium]|nr:hypothetical protein [Anaerolineales bacterium]